MPSAIFSHAHRVTYAECTSGNHIYYGRYLELMEAARGEFFRHLGRPFLVLQEDDFIFPAIEVRASQKSRRGILLCQTALSQPVIFATSWLSLPRRKVTCAP